MHIGLWGKARRKRPAGRQRCRREDNTKMALLKTGWRGMDWINLAQDKGPVGGSCEYCNEPSGSIKCWEILQ
jgi:hypothetical protein